MSNSYNYSDKSGCTRDDALGIMIGVGIIRLLPPKDDATQEEWDMHGQMEFTLADYMNEQYDSLSNEYAEAKIDKLPAVVIAEKLAAFNEIKSQVKDAIDVAPYLDDEIAKLAIGKPSALRFDVQCVSKPGDKRYSLKSVEECQQKIRTKIREKINSGRALLFPAQEKAIVHELSSRKYIPKSLPNNGSGKFGVRGEIRKTLVGSDLFGTDNAFERVWDKLIKKGTIAMK